MFSRAVFLVFLCVIFIITVAGVVVSAPSCVCDTSDCDDLQIGDCPGLGIVVYDPCRCCRVCARTEGEPCGGVLGFSGECEPGLLCQQQASSVDLDLDSNEGICQRIDIDVSNGNSLDP